MINYEKICREFNIKLVYSTDTNNINGGASTNDIIILYPCTKEWIKELSFWHELGHILLIIDMNKANRTHTMSTLSNEGAAWEIGLNKASYYGRKWKYNSVQMKWARKQLASYVNNEYDDLKRYYKK